MTGVFGFGPKLALRPRVRDLERLLGGVSMAEATSAGVPAGWYPDPAARHEQRYWDGTRWTADVADGDRTSTDDPGPS